MWARLYVLAFAICLLIPAAILAIYYWVHGHPSNPVSPIHNGVAVAMLMALVIACFMAGLGIRPRSARWSATLVLALGFLRYAYIYPRLGTTWAETFIFLGMSFPIFGGPYCVGIWLCFPKFHPGRRQDR